MCLKVERCTCLMKRACAMLPIVGVAISPIRTLNFNLSCEDDKFGC